MPRNQRDEYSTIQVDTIQSATGSSSSILIDSDLVFSAGEHLNFATTGTGTRIGTGPTQLLSFYGNSAIVQQTTTSQTPATLTANTSLIANDSATWNGYTIGDIVAILQAYGLIA